MNFILLIVGLNFTFYEVRNLRANTVRIGSALMVFFTRVPIWLIKNFIYLFNQGINMIQG